MFEVSREIRIPEEEFQWSYVRAGGPGGQNVNKVASKAVLRWNVRSSPSMPLEVKMRLLTLWSGRITGQGDLLFTSQRFRDQDKNRQDCLAKLRDMLIEASKRPKKRKATRPTRGSRESRLRDKKRRSGLKERRQRPAED